MNAYPVTAGASGVGRWAQRHVAETRGPADATLGTPCSHSRWQAPPITSTSPDPGARSWDRAPRTPNGRTRNGLARAEGEDHHDGVVELAQLAIAVERHAVATVAVVVERERAEGHSVAVDEIGSHLGQHRVRERSRTLA